MEPIQLTGAVGHPRKKLRDIMVKGAWLVVVAAAAAAAAAAVVNGSPVPEKTIHTDLVKYAFNNNGLGTYSFEYETADGTYRREDGGLVMRPDGSTLVVRGEYGYIDPDGYIHTLHYVADENGFQPQQYDTGTRYNDRRIL